MTNDAKFGWSIVVGIAATIAFSTLDHLLPHGLVRGAMLLTIALFGFDAWTNRHEKVVSFGACCRFCTAIFLAILCLTLFVGGHK